MRQLKHFFGGVGRGQWGGGAGEEKQFLDYSTFTTMMVNSQSLWDVSKLFKYTVDVSIQKVGTNGKKKGHCSNGRAQSHQEGNPMN